MNAYGPEIEIWGGEAGDNIDGIDINADNCTVANLIVSSFSYSGVKVRSGSQYNTIAGNYIGMNSSGTFSSPISPTLFNPIE